MYRCCRNKSTIIIIVTSVFLGCCVWNYGHLSPRQHQRVVPAQHHGNSLVQNVSSSSSSDAANIESDGATSLHKSSHKVNVVKDLAVGEYKVVNLAKLQPAVKICIFDSGKDQWVSGAIAKGGFWEGTNVKLFQAMLRSDQDLSVIDIGANIGQYTLVAAHMGRKVLAVEARKLHVYMVYKSLQLNNFLDRVTLVHNAISDSYTQVELGTYATNQGGTHVLNSNATKSTKPKSVESDMSATTILMDDLASVVTFNKALMKIDIEGYEDRAFKHAKQLFKKVSIPLVMMEWNAMKKKPAETIEPILEWLQKEGYEAHTNGGAELKPIDYKEWPKWGFDVVFKHRDVTIGKY